MYTKFVVEGKEFYLTEDQYRKYKDEYDNFTLMYAGTPPSFENFVFNRLKNNTLLRE